VQRDPVAVVRRHDLEEIVRDQVGRTNVELRLHAFRRQDRDRRKGAGSQRLRLRDRTGAVARDDESREVGAHRRCSREDERTPRQIRE
jgi:hypothetical protein